MDHLLSQLSFRPIKLQRIYYTRKNRFVKRKLLFHGNIFQALRQRRSA